GVIRAAGPAREDPFASPATLAYHGAMHEPDPEPLRLVLRDEAATRALGRALAIAVPAGTTILLEGPLGAGKTALARAFVQARQGLAGAQVEEVPSPSYTLVQSYAAGAEEIWHADLYRLGGAAEVAELGLEAALGRATCLIEWPDRLPAADREGAIAIRLGPDGAGGRWAEVRLPRGLGHLAEPLRAPGLPEPAGAAAGGGDG
ncbi:MAG: tRNA (adenosine(37)-N6)-threonylcarbamoyltransferase complex ATPase subunit type 1 TsaE, partial [Gemmobacter sp.]